MLHNQFVDDALRCSSSVIGWLRLRVHGARVKTHLRGDAREEKNCVHNFQAWLSINIEINQKPRFSGLAGRARRGLNWTITQLWPNDAIKVKQHFYFDNNSRPMKLKNLSPFFNRSLGRKCPPCELCAFGNELLWYAQISHFYLTRTTTSVQIVIDRKYSWCCEWLRGSNKVQEPQPIFPMKTFKLLISFLMWISRAAKNYLRNINRINVTLRAVEISTCVPYFQQPAKRRWRARKKCLRRKTRLTYQRYEDINCCSWNIKTKIIT